MDIQSIYKLFLQSGQQVSTDSREILSGGMFFALKGETFNGNKFATIALENGCNYAIVDEAEYAIDERFILVDDVLKTLQDLALHHRKQMDIPVIGITGTNGKTTTKELTAAVLKQKYNLLYTEGNFNNHIGVPLTLLRLRPEHDMALIEMGANHPGEIRFLANIACPTVGLVTNVGLAHLEGFGSLDGVIATKSELYQYLRRHNCTIFANEMNEYLRHALMGDEYIKYGLDAPMVDIWGHVEDCTPFVNMKWKRARGNEYTIKTNLIAAYNAENILAAITVGVHFGVDENAICQALEAYVPSNNRSQLKHTDKNTLIIDAYNANPTSMSSALNNFKTMQYDNKCVILGDMLELGEQSHVEHLNIVRLLKSIELDNVILVGKEFAKIANPFTCFDSCKELNAWLDRNPLEGKMILLKGSNGIGLKNCIEKL